MRALTGMLWGAAAGAAGTTALNAVTYLDMAVRGRPASSTPEDTVEKLAELASVPIPGEDATRANRVAGLGPLSGIATGVGIGATFGLLRAVGFRPPVAISSAVTALGAMVASNGPMTALRITDPRTWSVTDWVSDIVPHLAYGSVTASVLDRLDS